MVTIIPSELDARQRHQLLISTVCPRPIALASTIDKDGNRNLAPFSFFNVFSSTPPILIFSPNTSVRGGNQKDTLVNIKETGEVVINVVNHDMARQMVLTGYDYDKGVNEFVKSGLTPLESQLVKPFRVKESPVQLECKVIEVKSLGQEPGAANLVISEILAVHINPDILDEKNRVDPLKYDVVGRLGGFGYARITPEVVFDIPQGKDLPIGFDAIPETIIMGDLLTRAELSLLAGVSVLPTNKQVSAFRFSSYFDELQNGIFSASEREIEYVCAKLKTLIASGEIAKAWMLILALKGEGML